MRAAVVHPGPEPSVVAAEWPDPVAAAGWVTVRVRSASLNRLDRMMIADADLITAPAVLGSDAAGVVVDLGAGVTGVAVGDEVVILPTLWWGDDDAVQDEATDILGFPVQGSHAELVTVPAENVFPKPARLSWQETAALPMAGLTAWRALVTRGRLAAGETVVVTAASSGVSTFAIQIATALGAQVVAVTSGASNAARARQLGAVEVVRRDEPDLAGRLAAAAGGADLVLDPTGASWPALIGATRPGGRLVAIGRRGSSVGAVPVQALYWKHLDLLGSSMGSPRDFAALLRHLDDASWRPVVDSTYPLARIGDAYRRLDDAQRFGKVVLDLDLDLEHAPRPGRRSNTTTDHV